MAVPPILAVVDFDGAGGHFLGAGTIHNRHREGLRPLRREHERPVAIGLLVVVLMGVEQQLIGS